MREPHGTWIGDAVARYERPLISYSTRLLNGDLQSAREVVQDAFLRLCAQDEKRVAPHLAEWLFAVCRNRAADVRRKEGRMKLLDNERRHELISATIDPATLAETNGDAVSILSMLDALPPNQAEVIRLKFQHGLSYDQIAGVTKLSSGNVGYLIHTGIKTLREKLRVNVRNVS